MSLWIKCEDRLPERDCNVVALSSILVNRQGDGKFEVRMYPVFAKFTVSTGSFERLKDPLDGVVLGWIELPEIPSPQVVTK